jgi:Cu(I)/Ag(I) efflux system membrane fusion protein
MDLVPDRSTAPGSYRGAGGGPDRVRLSPRARRLARIETAAVRRARPRASRRLLGRLERDESALSAVTAWVSGRIEKLHVDTTGVRVRRGQRLASIYSPEIYAAQSDLQVAMRQLRASEGTPGRSSAQKAVEASRQRLALLGMPEFAIDRMAERSSPQTRVPIRSPATGTVLERQVTQGQYVETGDVLYRVADLSTLWVQLDAHGSDLGNLEVGDPVTLGLPAMPELSLHGQVRFVEPTVDPQTRVAEVRVEVPNRKGVLRPGMYVEAVVETRKESSQKRIFVVPESAVIFTGRRSVVYVEENNAEGEPVYVPRRVVIGQILDGAYSIASGLSEGERVVVEGAFVLDADLQIRGGPSALSAEAPAGEAGR